MSHVSYDQFTLAVPNLSLFTCRVLVARPKSAINSSQFMFLNQHDATLHTKLNLSIIANEKILAFDVAMDKAFGMQER